MTRLGTAAPARDVTGPDGIRAYAVTDAGLQREVNEDRVSCDTERGIFMVIDGVVALAMGPGDPRSRSIGLALRASPDRVVAGIAGSF